MDTKLETIGPQTMNTEKWKRINKYKLWMNKIPDIT